MLGGRYRDEKDVSYHDEPALHRERKPSKHKGEVR